jgi:uncharacterized membrane protein
MFKHLLIALILFLVLDALYLGSTTNHWNNVLLRIQGDKLSLKLIPAICVYILIFFGWYHFVYSSYLVHNSINTAIKDAFLLGLTTYGIYEFTNYAIFDKWDITSVLMDMSWGAILYTLVTYLTLTFV